MYFDFWVNTKYLQPIPSRFRYNTALYKQYIYPQPNIQNRRSAMESKMFAPYYKN